MRTLFPAWQDRPGMLGLRVSFFSRESQTWLLNGDVDWIWPATKKVGIPMMFLTYSMVAKFAYIAERHPGLKLIIDHLGISNAMAKEGKLAQGIADAVAVGIALTFEISEIGLARRRHSN